MDRAEVAVDMDALRAGFEGKRVLVTGAAGSIGSELVRHIP
jgi:FlaA1/EpsC-like NDP-sugar epimerase